MGEAVRVRVEKRIIGNQSAEEDTSFDMQGRGDTWRGVVSDVEIRGPNDLWQCCRGPEGGILAGGRETVGTMKCAVAR